MTRASLKLPREAKLLLLLLLMLALIGAWFLWTRANTRAVDAGAASQPGSQQGAVPVTAGPDASSANPNPADPNPVSPGSTDPNPADPSPANGAVNGDGGSAGTGNSPANDPATGSGTVPVAPGTGAATGQGAPESGALAVQPNRPVEVEVIPPFPTPQVDSAPVDAAVTSGGINPQASLAAAPRNNPFRPLTLDPSTQTATTPGSTPNAVTPNNAAGSDSPAGPLTRVPAEQPTSFPSSNAGPLAISPIPGTGGSVEVSSGDLNGLPAIPGADGSTGLGAVNSSTGNPDTGALSPIPGGDASSATSGRNPSGTPVSGSTPDRTVAGTRGDSGVTVIGGTGDTGRGNAGQDSVVVTAPKPPKPVVPPIAGVRVPSVNRVPVAAARPTTGNGAGNTGTGGSGAGGNAATRNGAATTSRPAASSAPEIIAELAQAVASGGSNAPVSAGSKLDQLIQSRQLAFNAAVLGPINTAIFRSQDGYVVVAVGQNLPDSQITVKEVNATSATLSLGNDLKTLELDQR